ncbi:MAG TPA: helix-turn-helix domain-containing protein [Caulobacteraceae bacterium]|nr:helix-turn-helix domain-containing protein [Caulobacteraceae bacterium]
MTLPKGLRLLDGSARECKVTPGEYVEGARIDAARNRLEGSDLALKAVAYDYGFSSVEHMRLVFVRRLGLTPSHYRSSFGRKVPKPTAG